jgi:hypothetical protein
MIICKLSMQPKYSIKVIDPRLANCYVVNHETTIPAVPS